MLPGAILAKALKPVAARLAKILKSSCRLQQIELAKRLLLNRSPPLASPSEKELPSVFITEALDHMGSIARWTWIASRCTEPVERGSVLIPDRGHRHRFHPPEHVRLHLRHLPNELLRFTLRVKHHLVVYLPCPYLLTSPQSACHRLCSTLPATLLALAVCSGSALACEDA